MKNCKLIQSVKQLRVYILTRRRRRKKKKTFCQRDFKDVCPPDNDEW